MSREEFVEGGFYHIYNRGTDKRDIFLDDQDRFRFIHYLYSSNGNEPTEKLRAPIIGGPTSDNKGREKLVDIICYVLMPNHFHLLVQQRVPGGISKFVQKFSTGYTMYFNTKNDRTGVLFQGKFKSKLVDDEKYLSGLVSYIHANPLELFQSNWKEDGIKDKNSAERFLEKYRWSSYADYLGKKNFPSLLNFAIIREVAGDAPMDIIEYEVADSNGEGVIEQLLFD